MTKRLIVPLLLLLNGIINLFPETLGRYSDWGYYPISVRTVLGLISAVIAIALISNLKGKTN